MNQEIKDTIDNGESEVQLTTIGKVIGTGANGEPVEQNLTEESLKKLAETHKDDEILVDADHQSEVGGKTEAKGWLSNLFVKDGVGLFGKIKWTDIGRKLIENRVFRWLSPAWLLDKDTKEPVKMTSVALTNKPSQAGKIEPIVNSAPIELNNYNMETITMEMTKEELVQLIKDTIEDLKKEKAVEKVEQEIKNENEVHEDIVENLEEKKEAIESGVVPTDALNSAPTCKNECGDEKPVKNAEDETTEVKEEIVEEKKEDEDDDKDGEQVADDEKKEEIVEEVEEKKDEEEEKKDGEQVAKEVIPLEALNSAPKTVGVDIVKGGTQSWQKLSDAEFIKWIDSGMPQL